MLNISSSRYVTHMPINIESQGSDSPMRIVVLGVHMWLDDRRVGPS